MEVLVILIVVLCIFMVLVCLAVALDRMNSGDSTRSKRKPFPGRPTTYVKPPSTDKQYDAAFVRVFHPNMGTERWYNSVKTMNKVLRMGLEITSAQRYPDFTDYVLKRPKEQ